MGGSSTAGKRPRIKVVLSPPVYDEYNNPVGMGKTHMVRTREGWYAEVPESGLRYIGEHPLRESQWKDEFRCGVAIKWNAMHQMHCLACLAPL